MPSDHDSPDGIFGAVLAFEGIRDAATVMNGPTGCKSYPSWFSERSYPCRDRDPYTDVPFKYYKRFFFTQPRVPCTYMDSDDYIMGTCGKLDEVFEEVMSLKPNLIGIINSPGASLIGETLSLKDEKGTVVRIESPEPSVPMGTGFQNTMMRIVERISPRKHEKRKGVNLVGISIWDLHWEDSIDDLKQLLGLCGISVNTVIGAGCSVSELKDSGSAELNVVIYRDFASEIVKWYERELNVPYVESKFGAPIGFDALEDWILGICKKLNADPSGAMEAIKNKRQRAANVLLSLYTVHKPVIGHTFSISANGAIVHPIMTFLYDYLGMLPVAFNTGADRTFDSEIERFVNDNGLDVSGDVFDTPADVIIGDGASVASAEYRGVAIGGYDVARQGRIIVPIRERPVLGLGGTMNLLDEVMNVVRRMD